MNRTAFIFDDVSITPDRQIGCHSHPQWELSEVICGSGLRTIGDCTEPMSEGEIILIPPNIAHVWHFDPTHTDSNGNIANISIFFESQTLDALANALPEMAPHIGRLKSQTRAVSYIGEQRERIAALLAEMRGASPIERAAEFLKLIEAMAETDGCIPAGRSNSMSRTQRRLENVRIYCSCNYAREITLNEVAAHVGMNKSAFCTFMRRQTGMSLSEYVNDLRLSRAMEMLLNSDRTIASVAYDAGFANVTYFNRLFKSKFNQTPKSVRMNKIDPELRSYVEEQIIPRYAEFDKAHQADHVNMVIAQSLKLASSLADIDRNMAYAAAAFHDLGLVNGRENHHVDSRRILENDEFIKAHFSAEQIRLMGEAVEDHRASKSGRPRNVYGLIVAEADRFIDGETTVRRAIQYGLRNYPQLDREGHFERTVGHLTNKYGPDGYLKIWLPQSDNAARLDRLRRLIADPAAIRALFDRIYNEETNN